MRTGTTSMAILTLCLLLTPAHAADSEPGLEHASAGLGLAFEIPPACVAREEIHHPDDPSRQIAHSVLVSCGGPVLLRIDMWEDPGGGDIGTWAAARLAPLIRGADRVTSAARSRLALPAVIITRGHTPQTAPRRLVAMRIGERVHLLTLERADEGSSMKVLASVLDSLRLLGGGDR